MTDEEDEEVSEQDELPYDVEVAFQHLSAALDEMSETWQSRGWRDIVVLDKVREKLVAMLEEF